MGFVKTILLIVVTIFVPPLGVFLIAGCGVDLLINILLTILGYLPGHIHAFYLEYIYFKRKDEIRAGIYDGRSAPGVYSERVQRGGRHRIPTQQTQPVSGPPGAGYVDARGTEYGTVR
ncbi:putative stress response RCI peptide [Lojkania enalia]|uniref:Stress response RCI peptide n=1 Tax=Lojkania enalia TaxID=147567 RepID=A0A9P4NAE3_9PLEO|nr:putative stress response RCI peptide [Didymosphaeria enalia]